MADHSKIEWTDATWNPLRGCSRVSDGCRHCYAETVARRFSGSGQPYEGLIHPKTHGWNGAIKLVPEALSIPWRWTKGRRIFVNSMSDLFHESVPFEYIAAVFWIMSVTTRHKYQVLTKRPARMLEFFAWLTRYGQSDDDTAEIDFIREMSGFGDSYISNRMCAAIGDAADTIPEIKAIGWVPATATRGGYDNCGPGWPYENIWLGVSVEDQATANERIPLLLQAPAAVRWISAEPLLGPIDLNAIRLLEDESWTTSALRRDGCAMCSPGSCTEKCRWRWPTLDWIVAGGESGQGARPMHPDWARSLRDQCAQAHVPFLFKQWGAWAPDWDGAMTCDGCGRTKAETARTRKGQDECGYCGGCEWTEANKPLDDLRRVGKKKAGRLLDGVQHDGYPA